MPETAQNDALAFLASGAACPSGSGVPAPEAVLLARVSARRNDTSDADAAVLRGQLADDPSARDWTEIATGGTLGATLAAARAALGSGTVLNRSAVVAVRLPSPRQKGIGFAIPRQEGTEKLPSVIFGLNE